MEEQIKTPVAAAVEQAIKPEAQPIDPVVMVRQAIVSNFIQHFVNAAAADKAENPFVQGVITAINELMVVVLSQDESQSGKNIPMIAQAIATVGFGSETNLAEQLMIAWSVSAGRSGQLNSLLGKLRDASEGDYRNYLQQQFAVLHPNPEPVAAELETAPQIEPINEPVYDQEVAAESLPVESLEVIADTEAEAAPVEG